MEQGRIQDGVEQRPGRGPDLSRPVRSTLVGLFLLVAAAGLARSQTYAMDALGPAPGVWPRWAFWPGLALLGLLLTQLPSRWPRWVRRGLGAVSIVTFPLSAILLDAAICRYLLEEHTGAVTTATDLHRSVQRVSVTVDGAALSAYSPAASFAGRQSRSSVTGTRHYRPGSAYGQTTTYAVGDPVTVQVDRSGRLHNRVLPQPGQGGYLPWFPRTPGVVGASTLGLVLGWGAILTACAGVALRGARRH